MAQASFVLSLQQQPLPLKISAVNPSMSGLRNKTQVKDNQDCESFIDMRRENLIGLHLRVYWLVWYNRLGQLRSPRKRLPSNDHSMNGLFCLATFASYILFFHISFKRTNYADKKKGAIEKVL